VARSDEQVELAVLKTVLHKLDRIEDELEELEELQKPPAPNTYPRTVGIVVA